MPGQGGIIIPDGVTDVTGRAHDRVDGFGGQPIHVNFEVSSGLGFTVERLPCGGWPLACIYQHKFHH